MRFAVVTQKLIKGDGQGRINLAVARGLADAGHEVTVVSSEIDPALAALPNVTWRRIAIPARIPTELLQNLLFAVKARRALAADADGYDILQINGDITSGPSDVNVSMFVHSNWIQSPYHPYHARSGAYGRYQRLYTRLHARGEKRAFSAARRVVALSELVRDSLIADVGLDPTKISVILPGVDTEEFRSLRPEEPNRLREVLGLPPDVFLAFFTGDIVSNRKNLDLSLRALAQLSKEIHIAVAGGLPGSPYPAMAMQLGIADRVHFLGYRKDVPLLLRGADAFVFPSHYDTFALVVTEALASGIPTITAPTVGAASVIQHGENGFLLQSSNDLEGMAAILRRLMSDRAFAHSVGQAARVTAETLTWEAMAARYEQLFVEILAEKQESSPSTLSPSQSHA